MPVGRENSFAVLSGPYRTLRLNRRERKEPLRCAKKKGLMSGLIQEIFKLTDGTGRDRLYLIYQLINRHFY